MSSSSSPALVCDVHARRTERRVAALALTASGCVPTLVGLPVPTALACSVVSMLLTWIGLRRAGWLATDWRLAALSWMADGRWLLTDQLGRTVEGRLRRDSRVSRKALWLRWDVAGWSGPGRRSLLLARGDISDCDLRRLVMRLRLEGQSVAGPDATEIAMS